ncbi:NADH-quinone oxidoreductase subunit L [Calderihabitans maritimus]|uniref:Proton-translocating NADH-quinone oxidoreductase subunit L n=1 Tax=Calderihabitans maritimus TaxID=1246530 RepID=A0A1Z5HTI7_9FIRM|nr:NADH-quinone oxidoreductase subunit L [Calderihabitans maritimus]GAW92856.1 proton-translocating NADH-quinone oxidoreductase subunit L [Calderihabitans maritimus]
MKEYAWLIPILPAIAFVIIVFVTRKLKMLSALVAIAAMAVAFVMSVGVLWEVIQSPEITMNNPYEYFVDWLNLPGVYIQAGVLIDPLTAVMLFVVTLVALLVEIYSIGYMHGDEGFSRFYAYLSLFAFSMLGLVVANNYFQMFFFWELVGLCSYLLIGYYFYKNSAAEANKKAFITNRVADFGFMLGIFFLWLVFGTFNFGELAEAIEHYDNVAFLTLAAILVFIGPVGKSAQFPLHVWLPDAMEGPTPVSALIHAATMVAAGVYLIARGYILFAKAPASLLVVAYVGGFTALFAATIAIVQEDIKRILAYSTLSQLGYMVMAMGVGSMTAGIFHLMTHAYFKALLFLGAGSAIHAVHSNSIFDMGGLYKKMPITTWTFVIGALALAGIFPLAGFWSKDEILLATKEGGFTLLYLVGSFVAFLTAFYMFRLIFIAFFGEKKSDHHAHESPWTMTVPLLVLAVFSIFGGFVGAPFVEHGFASFIYFEEPHHVEADIALMVTSTIISLAGIGLAWLIYMKKAISAEAIKKRFLPIYNLLYNKYYIDEVYQWFFDNVVLKIGAAFNWHDRHVVDGIADGLADTIRGIGARLRFVQTGSLQNYALVIFAAVVIIVLWMAMPVLGGIQ